MFWKEKERGRERRRKEYGGKKQTKQKAAHVVLSFLLFLLFFLLFFPFFFFSLSHWKKNYFAQILHNLVSLHISAFKRNKLLTTSICIVRDEKCRIPRSWIDNPDFQAALALTPVISLDPKARLTRSEAHFSFFPSLINRMVSVDVKHHVSFHCVACVVCLTLIFD